MSFRRWVKTWISTGIGIFILVYGFNFVIDPYGSNKKFTYDFNTVKKVLDEIESKVELLKGVEYNTFILGSSRSTYIDPEIINTSLKGARAINMAFPSATINEIELFLNYIKSNQREVKNIFIGIDLFAFSDDFNPRRAVSLEDLLVTGNHTGTPFMNRDYFSFKTFYDSLVVIIKNHSSSVKKNDKCEPYTRKGMRCHEKFLFSENYDVKKNVTDKKFIWHGNSFSFSKIEVLKRIFKENTSSNINIFVYTNPITFQQIYTENGFFVQLDLVEEIVRDSDIRIYDFNNLNVVNFNNKFFFDSTHFNYKVADCIITTILLDTSVCGNDFGTLIDKQNIKKYKETVKGKFNKLKDSNVH